jgi:hypothetical protein
MPQPPADSGSRRIGSRRNAVRIWLPRNQKERRGGSADAAPCVGILYTSVGTARRGRIN